MKTALVLAVLVGAACATTKPPQALLQARATYADASVQAAASAPAELRDAELALDDADAAFQREGGSPEVRDRAYIAERKAEIAIAKARYVDAQKREQASDARIRALSATAAEQLRTTREAEREAREEHSVDEERVRDLEQRAAQLQAELDQQKQANEERGEALENTQEQLQNEQQARRDVEQRLTTTLEGIRDLQSVQEEPRGLVITLSGQVLFASGKFDLLPAARTALDNVAAALKADPDRSITVEGYTDSQGSPASNLVLSQARAESVRRYLIERGVPEDKIGARGMGEDNPVASNDSIEGRANNRRVEIVVAPKNVEPR
jgi:outer membrane protein OmpA-like peptidoglycan-associated protein